MPLFIYFALAVSIMTFQACSGSDDEPVTNSSIQSSTDDDDSQSSTEDTQDTTGTDTSDDQTGTEEEQTDTEEEESYTVNIVGGYTGQVTLYREGVYFGIAKDLILNMDASEGDYVTLNFNSFSVGEQTFAAMSIENVYVETADEVTYTLSGSTVSGTVNSDTGEANVTFTFTSDEASRASSTTYTATYSTADNDESSETDGTGSGYNNGGDY